MAGRYPRRHGGRRMGGRRDYDDSDGQPGFSDSDTSYDPGDYAYHGNPFHYQQPGLDNSGGRSNRPGRHRGGRDSPSPPSYDFPGFLESDSEDFGAEMHQAPRHNRNGGGRRPRPDLHSDSEGFDDPHVGRHGYGVPPGGSDRRRQGREQYDLHRLLELEGGDSNSLEAWSDDEPAYSPYGLRDEYGPRDGYGPHGDHDHRGARGYNDSMGYPDGPSHGSTRRPRGMPESTRHSDRPVATEAEEREASRILGLPQYLVHAWLENGCLILHEGRMILSRAACSRFRGTHYGRAFERAGAYYLDEMSEFVPYREPRGRRHRG